MPLSNLVCSTTRPRRIYPRLHPSTLSCARPSQIQTTQTKSTYAPEWTHHCCHKPGTLHSSSFSPHLRALPARPLSDFSRTANTTSTLKAPFFSTAVKMQRPSTPYQDPKQQGPRAQQLASGTQQDLRKMLNHTVNKTGLHPGGVAYVFTTHLFPAPHDAIQGEELGRMANMYLSTAHTRNTLISVRPRL